MVLKNFYKMNECPYHPSDWHAYGPATRDFQSLATLIRSRPVWRNG